MKKTIILATIIMALAGVAVAQTAPFPATLVIASGQSLSPVFTPGTRGTNSTAMSVLQIFPPAALDATSCGLQVYSCTDVAGATCLPLADKDGVAIKFTIVGCASPTSAIQLEPGTMAGGRTFKFQVVTSTGAAVAQTANRTFTLMVRPL